MRILTELSGVFWYKPFAQVFDRAVLPKMSVRSADPDNPIQTCWLDVLLEGGLVLPPYSEEEPRALTILLTGTPGSGKTTLALELAYRWALRTFQSDGGRGAFHQRQGWSTVYVTSELSLPWAKSKAGSMGWERVKDIFLDTRTTETIDHADNNGEGRVFILQSSEIDFHHGHSSRADSDRGETVMDLAHIVAYITTGVLTGVAHGLPVVAPMLNLALRFFRRGGVERSPEVVIFDSLDTLSPDAQDVALERLDKLRASGPRVVIMVLNEGHVPSTIEFQADLILRCATEVRSDKDYLVRTLEIKKARFQSHVWNAQQLKIYGPTRFEGNRELTDLQRRRGHPYREEGGIFVFPSIHFFLSRYKRESPDNVPDSLSTSLDELDEMLSGGLPKGRCTGLVGMRGGHKSHLGYRCILNTLKRDPNSRGLIISLRDDEGTARQAISGRENTGRPEGILGELDLHRSILENYRIHDRLEVLYFPPGNITADEMFHRIYLSLIRMREKDGDVTLLFNSLDQLRPRFPLCASEEIFVPGLIETLSAEGVTSVFIGVDEAGQPEQQYGLLSMADLLLHFKQQKISTETYLQRWNEVSDAPVDMSLLEDYKGKIGEFQFPVVARVARFAGGQAAGASGMLELVKDRGLFDGDTRKGLCFCQLRSADYEYLS